MYHSTAGERRKLIRDLDAIVSLIASPPRGHCSLSEDKSDSRIVRCDPLLSPRRFTPMTALSFYKLGLRSPTEGKRTSM